MMTKVEISGRDPSRKIWSVLKPQELRWMVQNIGSWRIWWPFCLDWALSCAFQALFDWYLVIHLMLSHFFHLYFQWSTFCLFFQMLQACPIYQKAPPQFLSWTEVEKKAACLSKTHRKINLNSRSCPSSWLARQLSYQQPVLCSKLHPKMPLLEHRSCFIPMTHLTRFLMEKFYCWFLGLHQVPSDCKQNRTLQKHRSCLKARSSWSR